MALLLLRLPITVASTRDRTGSDSHISTVVERKMRSCLYVGTVAVDSSGSICAAASDASDTVRVALTDPRLLSSIVIIDWFIVLLASPDSSEGSSDPVMADGIC